MTVYTNLPLVKGTKYAPVLNIDAPKPKGRFDFVVIDHEGNGQADEKAIWKGEEPAATRAVDNSIQIAVEFEKVYAPTPIGFYGWPPVSSQLDVKRSTNFAVPLTYCDYVFPVFAKGSASESPQHKARLFMDAIDWLPSSISNKPRIAFVGIQHSHTEQTCSPQDICDQVEAARIAGCQGIYVWSGLSYQMNLAFLPSHASPADKADQPKAIARLAGLGVEVDIHDRPKTQKSLNKITQPLLRAFVREWAKK